MSEELMKTELVVLEQYCSSVQELRLEHHTQLNCVPTLDRAQRVQLSYTEQLYTFTAIRRAPVTRVHPHCNKEGTCD